MSSPAPEHTQSRKRPGAACVECRRRKMRCDGKQPQCENCVNSGVECIFSPSNTRRGPKKGHLKSLQIRITNLENRLLEQRHDHSTATGGTTSVQPFSHGYDGRSELNVLPHEFHVPGAIPGPSAATIPVSDLLHAELDQLYFDRVHDFVPVVHRHRYLSWTKDADKHLSRRSLQYAMWSMAASMSTQLDHLCDPLYRSARGLLEASGLTDDPALHDTEHVQALLVLSIYEFTRHTFRRGWISAGQCFRLVQLMNWHRIDTNLEAVPLQPDELICMEEKRRVFWMAYVLDRFVCTRLENPLTFDERIITTRLPATENAFLTGQLSQPTGFLPEIIAAGDSVPRTWLTECIVLAALCGQIFSHKQQTTVEQVLCGVSSGFWQRHQWLEALLVKKSQIISAAQLLIPAGPIDPMLLFLNLVAHSNLLYHCTAVDSVSPTDSDVVLGYQQRAWISAQEIVRLTRMVSELNHFEIHPFTPLPIMLCAKFFMTHPNMDISSPLQLQEVLGTLQRLAETNYLSRDCLSRCVDV
ncbi:citrinin biosynthesis transcriptional activator CtnR [Aspergillus heteromorphus CBS 117.55]|uniref:Citrinin biosynthesis transcriptional activator CtnR n=1 Tax=Aspergillus heteromorphus CBS 117.55 TaxID=1448321 RepID=A0A317VNH8_9EURO|nr:citrinin biosynthesis transcriptional activator CtnR [Aspergillus heteromorphus CBS 117.55]PWY75485.1 citrinin biosynthesis transcriptional activator CtnR [Aspergillus heteromorphus CBS 117.55]